MKVIPETCCAHSMFLFSFYLFVYKIYTSPSQAFYLFVYKIYTSPSHAFYLFVYKIYTSPSQALASATSSM